MGGVQGRRPGRGPGGSAPGSSGFLPILNALVELSWTLLICIFMIKNDTDYAGEKEKKWQNW